MIRITLTVTSEQAAALVRERGSSIIAALARQISLETLRLQAHIVANHLSGPPGLRQITGRLARSIRVIPTQVSEGSITGAVEGAGENAFYGKFHEYGTSRSYEIVPVRAKALVFEVNGQTVFAKRVVHPPIQARPFMRSSLAERRQEIIADMEKAMYEAVTPK